MYKGISPPFSLVMGQPYEEIPLKPLADTKISRYKVLLLHVHKEYYSSQDNDVNLELLDYFSTSIKVC